MSRVLSGKLRKAGRRVGSVSSVWSTTAGGHRDTQGWKPRALFIQQEFLFKISEIPLVQWNGAFRLHRPDPSHRAFGYCSYKQDTKKRYWGQQFCQMEGDISVRPTEMTRPVKVDHLQSWYRTFRSDQTEMVRTIWCTNRSFGSFGLNGKCSEPR